MTAPILELLNVESNYGPVQALRGVSLSVTEGKIVTVLGANGAGKTTTLKTISGIIAPLKGQVKFRGQDIQGRSPDTIVRGGVVHVPEGREVFPLLSVEDNLRMGAYTRTDADGVARDLEAVFGYFPILRERRGQEAGPSHHVTETDAYRNVVDFSPKVERQTIREPGESLRTSALTLCTGVAVGGVRRDDDGSVAASSVSIFHVLPGVPSPGVAIDREQGARADFYR